MLYVSILYYFLLLSSIPLCQYIIIFLFIGWWTLVLSIVNRTDLHTYVFVRTYASITLGQNTKVVLLDFMVSVCFIKKKKTMGLMLFQIIGILLIVSWLLLILSIIYELSRGIMVWFYLHFSGMQWCWRALNVLSIRI